VSITTYTYAPVGGKKMPVVPTAGRMPTTPDDRAGADHRAPAWRGSPAMHRLVGGVPRSVTVTGIGFVPQGPHNDYDSGGWMTVAGYDRLFSGARYSFKPLNLCRSCCALSRCRDTRPTA
jgi:hypothetical protein